MRKENGSYETLQNTYFRNMINEDRKQIKRRVCEITKESFDAVKNEEFDSEFPKIMKNFNLNENALINMEYSYNITYIPMFRDAAYYEFITPYLKVKSS